jgi:hypothetical protein
MAAGKSAQIEERLYLANRWSLLPEFLEFVAGVGFGLDEGTAVVIDMDKTAVGARGRNDAVIDEARLEGVHNTVAGLLGEDFDETAFRAVYSELNRPAYHAFTADNQDYLAYICLMLGAACTITRRCCKRCRAARFAHLMSSSGAYSSVAWR